MGMRVTRMNEDWSSEDVEDVSDLSHAVAAGDVEAIRAYVSLQDVQCVVDAGDLEQMLCTSAELGHLDVVKYLIEYGVDIHCDVDYPLRTSADEGHLEVVRYLMEHGADVQARGFGAVEWAAQEGRLQVIQYFVERWAVLQIMSDSQIAYTVAEAILSNHYAVAEYVMDQVEGGRQLIEPLSRNGVEGVVQWLEMYCSKKEQQALLQSESAKGLGQVGVKARL